MHLWTRRDEFAKAAMQGMIAAPENGDGEHASVMISDGLSFGGGWRGRIAVAVASYAMADAMMKAREVRNEIT